MRDIGVLVWVVFIVIGVVANIASAARKQSQSSAAAKVPRPMPPRQMDPPRAQTPVVPARRPPATAPATRPLLVHEVAPPRRRAFFPDAPSVVRAVVAAEVLGKPRALRDE